MSKRKVEDELNSKQAKQKHDESDLSTLTVNQLKEQCRANGLPVSGTKEKLLQRLKFAPAKTGATVRITPAQETKALKAAGVSDINIANTDAKELKKKMTAAFKKFHELVDADWHDGYEEQGETISEWFTELIPVFQSVHDLAFVKKDFFSRCQEVLMIISDTTNNLDTVGARVAWRESLGGEDHVIKRAGDSWTFRNADIFGVFWRVFLACAATSPSVENNLYRWIKNCVDNSISLSGPIAVSSIGNFEEFEEGYKKVQEIYANQKEKWESLPKLVKHHAKKRIIDRRFDGPKHLRTRDYPDFWGGDGDSDDDSDDDDEDGW